MIKELEQYCRVICFGCLEITLSLFNMSDDVYSMCMFSFLSMFLNADFFIYAEGHRIPYMRIFIRTHIYDFYYF
jgi:hypothetical protein